MTGLRLLTGALLVAATGGLTGCYLGSPTVTSGDCNSCHTLAGANGAPGRVMLP